MASSTPPNTRPLAIVTGASSGIGYELALLTAREGFDLIVAADTSLDDFVAAARECGANVTPLQVDLATAEGVESVCNALAGRAPSALIANAGHGLGRAFLEQNFEDVQHVIDTNITGTLYLLQKVARLMVARSEERILITGSIAGFMPGSFHAVYKATKASID